MLAPCLVSSEGSLLGLQRAAFSLCPYTAFPLCFHILGVCVYIFSSYKDTSQIGLGPPLWRPHFQMHSHFQILWFRVSTYEFRRNTTEPIMRHHDSLFVTCLWGLFVTFWTYLRLIFYSLMKDYCTFPIWCLDKQHQFTIGNLGSIELSVNFLSIARQKIFLKRKVDIFKQYGSCAVILLSGVDRCFIRHPISCSGPHAKQVVSCETESEQLPQTLKVFLPESKEVHQSLCLFFRERWCAIKSYVLSISEYFWVL